MRRHLFACSISLLLVQGACSKKSAQPEPETPTVATEPATPVEAPEATPTASTNTAGDDGPVVFPNLQVLPKSTSEDELKLVMQSVSKSLGVQCDHCHNVENWGEESEMKGKARSMIEMTMGLNQNHFGGEMRVTCMTCHQGKTTPNVD